MTPLLLKLPAEDAKLAPSLMARHPLPVPVGDDAAVLLELRHVQRAEPVDDSRVGGAVELRQHRPFPKGDIEPGGVAGVLEEGGEPGRRILVG